MSEVVALRNSENSPVTQVRNHFWAISHGIDGLKELALTNREEVERIALGLMNKSEELKALAAQAAGIDLAASPADDAVDTLIHAANEVRQIGERSPGAIVRRVQEINQVAYTISGILMALRMMRKAALADRIRSPR